METTVGADRRVALVTGGTRGIGVAIARQLLQRGYLVLLGARDLATGRRVASTISSSSHECRAVELDVTAQTHVDALRLYVEQNLGRMDAIVNNAAAYWNDDERPASVDLDVAAAAFQVNCVGAWRVAQAFILMMRDAGYGRIVNVTSGVGSFHEIGVTAPAYAVSKAGLNMVTAMLAAELHGTGILVNSVHPGWVRTDMGGPDAPRSVEQGADTPVWAATLPDGGPSGGFFYNRRPIPW